jgi:PIN domain nuclease of toxin-antitoxin system
MIILLDTCEFLWFVSADPKLAAKYKQAIEDPSNTIFLSVVSLWEVITKERIGKLSFPKPAAEYIPEKRALHKILSLDLSEVAVKRLSELPLLHRDPFDRMLICQVQAQGIRLASSDPIMSQYPVDLL